MLKSPYLAGFCSGILESPVSRIVDVLRLDIEFSTEGLDQGCCPANLVAGWGTVVEVSDHANADDAGIGTLFFPVPGILNLSVFGSPAVADEKMEIGPGRASQV